jgi:hypothetical protein
MAKGNVTAGIGSLKKLLSGDDYFVRDAVRGYLQDVLEEEMTASRWCEGKIHSLHPRPLPKDRKPTTSGVLLRPTAWQPGHFNCG